MTYSKYGTLILALLGPLAEAGAATFVVSPRGDDNNSGAPAAPFRTLQRAADTATAGDMVLVEKGSYQGFLCRYHSGTAAARITFKARRRGDVVINQPPAGITGDDALDFVKIRNQSYITIDGFEVTRAPRAGIYVLSDVDTTGESARDNTIQNCHAHHNGVAISRGRHDGIFSSFALNLTVQDNQVHDNAEHGIYVSNSADRPIIRRNVSHHNGVTGIQLNADLSFGGDGTISNWLIEDNIVYSNYGGAAVNLDGAVGGVLRNNLIYDNDKGGVTLYQGDGAMASSDNLLVNNTIYDPQGSRAALQVADGANNNVVFNNILYSGSFPALEVQSVLGLLHDYNIVGSYVGAAPSAHESSPAAAQVFCDGHRCNLHLRPGSPAVGAGVPSYGSRSAPGADLDGVSRIGRPYDLGAYAFTGSCRQGG